MKPFTARFADVFERRADALALAYGTSRWTYAALIVASVRFVQVVPSHSHVSFEFVAEFCANPACPPNSTTTPRFASYAMPAFWRGDGLAVG